MVYLAQTAPKVTLTYCARLVAVKLSQVQLFGSFCSQKIDFIYPINLKTCCVFVQHILIISTFRCILQIMRTINSNQVVKLPKGVSAKVNARVVTIRGPRGKLTRDFRHLAMDIRMVNRKKIMVEKWFGAKKEIAAVRTVCSHIENMIKGELTSLLPIFQLNWQFAQFRFRCYKRIPIQDESRTCSFPHQLCHFRKQHSHWDP